MGMWATSAGRAAAAVPAQPPPALGKGEEKVAKGAKSGLAVGGRCSIVILANSGRGGAGKVCQTTPVHRAAGGGAGD